MRANGLVVAIDGPSGAGKSSAGRALAAQLGYTYIDTGAMYRALALKASRTGVSLDSEEALAALLRASSIELADGGRRVLLDHHDVTADARSRETSRASSLVSVHPGVRVEMVARQREMGKQGGVVLDGRDIGTAVFPDAEVKFFLDADPAERARRRLGELRAAGNDVSFDAIEKEVRERDYTDTHRAESPLQRAWDAIALDTTALSHEEVVERMLEVADLKKGEFLIDLGCGDGRIPVTAAKKYGVRGLCIDLDPNRIREANENVKKQNVGNLVEVRQQNLFETDISKADVISMYLLTDLNLKLRPKLLELAHRGIARHELDQRDLVRRIRLFAAVAHHGEIRRVTIDELSRHTVTVLEHEGDVGGRGAQHGHAKDACNHHEG